MTDIETIRGAHQALTMMAQMGEGQIPEWLADIGVLLTEIDRLTAQRDAALALCDEWAESWRATGSKGSTLERAAEAMRRALGVTRT